MKNLFLGLMLLAGTTMTFAGTEKFIIGEATEKFVEKPAAMPEDKAVSCTVRITAPNYNVTITVTCNDCTASQACNAAYKLASIGL